MLIDTRWYRFCRSLYPRDTWAHAFLAGYLFWAALFVPLNIALLVWLLLR